eukprot:TRINITY_DN14386_c0_g1_i1.p1 TRINITY_DN14386_c0_g1~~TRINITY_DN14386_c0_g1_i1.p1  ORF type:complete len:192 (+),score=21.55 TRINITY_DN14386_c0_g1_i1:67-642(+)
MIRPILITGVPGIGKTTLFKKLMSHCGRAGCVSGFYVDEERAGGEGRTGFSIVTIPEGKRAKLAALERDVGKEDRPKVGRWSVYLKDFEETCLPILRTIETESRKQTTKSIMMVDEIGKMELLSSEFTSLMTSLLSNPPDNLLIICTIALHGSGLVASAKTLPNVDVHEVTSENRDDLPEKLMKTIDMRMR